VDQSASISVRAAAARSTRALGGNQVAGRTLITILIAASLVTGCVTSPANVGWLYHYDKHPTGVESVVVGVVNGVYEYNPQLLRKRLDKYGSDLSESERDALSRRYVIRVGYKRMARGAVLLPVVPPKLSGKASEYVILPEGWIGDAFKISADSRTINVGDVVSVRVLSGRLYDYLEGVVRKCNDNPASDEDKEWNIGCRTYKHFDQNGYAGEKYFFRAF